MAINTRDYGKRQKLDAATVFTKKGQNAIVLRVSDARQVDIPDKEQESGFRRSIVVNFEEFPDHAYWPNNTGVLSLVEMLGDEETQWKGERVPLILANTTNPQTGRPTKSVWVAAPEDWDDILGEFGGRRKRGRPAKKATKTTAKTTAKRGRKAR